MSVYVENPHGTHQKYLQGCRCDSCRSAHAKEQADYRKAHPERESETHKRYYFSRKDKILKSTRDYQFIRRSFVNEIKRSCICEECGEDHPLTLQFHHRNPAEKRFHISDAGKHGFNSIREELAKCGVLCSKCHTDLHRREQARGYKR